MIIQTRCPTVSILMPVRNEGRFLAAALHSLQAQTLKDWELVAVDDGSTDDTPLILAGAAKCDPRIRLLASGGQGLVAALNNGLAACRAPLVARMDGDDISHPKRLATQAALMLHGAPVLATNQVQAKGVKLLMTVGARGARDVVRQSSFQAGFREGDTSICVA